jgi:phosphomannomutase
MAWHGKHLGELVAMLHREFGEHHYGRVDLNVRDGRENKAMSYFSDTKLTKLLDWPITRREHLDGLKMYLGDIGWAMVRASGTENMLRVYSETTRAETTRRVLDEVTSRVKNLH